MNPTPSARRIATPIELALGVMFGLQPALAQILALMYSGETVTALRTHIHRLRSALPDEAVDTASAGYQLTDAGRAECDQAIADFREWVSK